MEKIKEDEKIKVQLWKNRNELSDKYAIIDKEDYDKVIEAIRYKSGKPGKWYYLEVQKGYGYAMNGDRRNSIHRVVMDAPKGMDVDHINGDRLNNTKSNLRVCTRSQNSQNKKLRSDSASGYKGVHKHGDNLKKPFNAYIRDPDKVSRSLKLGYYVTAEEAARVYDKKALELHGEFAYINFPKEDYLLSDGSFEQYVKKERQPSTLQYKRQHSTSQYIGVHYHKAAKKWVANIRHNKKKIYIGYFTCEKEAAKAVNDKARELGLEEHFCFNEVD